MNFTKHHIRFPATDPHSLDQDQAYFLLMEDGQEVRFRFHEYADIYKRPDLYEQLFYQRLKCNSPKKVADILGKVLRENRIEMTELRVLDLGAGNGMFGEQLQAAGIARVIGVDICPEAREACERDRPGIYDAYYVCDFCDLDEPTRREIGDWQIDCLSCVAALGFGDIPARAFANAFNMVATGGWVAFNIKETFLLESDTSGFSRLVKSLLLSDALEVHHLERYRHRISIDGRPLFYYALVGRKEFNIPAEIMATLDAS
ncbi:MAG: class I SAM-dependent DNA methyltransferase [Pseudomonadota bacterium]|jgi:SAM-dependent methyltransferase